MTAKKKARKGGGHPFTIDWPSRNAMILEVLRAALPGGVPISALLKKLGLAYSCGHKALRPLRDAGVIAVTKQGGNPLWTMAENVEALRVWQREQIRQTTREREARRRRTKVANREIRAVDDFARPSIKRVVPACEATALPIPRINSVWALAA